MNCEFVICHMRSDWIYFLPITFFTATAATLYWLFFKFPIQTVAKWPDVKMYQKWIASDDDNDDNDDDDNDDDDDDDDVDDDDNFYLCQEGVEHQMSWAQSNIPSSHMLDLGSGSSTIHLKVFPIKASFFVMVCDFLSSYNIQKKPNLIIYIITGFYGR